MANRQQQIRIEMLESRMHLSSVPQPSLDAAASLSPANIFTVVGTHGNDTVTISDTSVVLNNSVITYPAGETVTYVDNGGNDSIVVNANSTPVVIDTGAGNDTITLNGAGSVQINTAASGGGSETLIFGAGAAPSVSFSVVPVKVPHGQGLFHRAAGQQRQ